MADGERADGGGWPWSWLSSRLRGSSQTWTMSTTKFISEDEDGEDGDGSDE